MSIQYRAAAFALQNALPLARTEGLCFEVRELLALAEALRASNPSQKPDIFGEIMTRKGPERRILLRAYLNLVNLPAAEGDYLAFEGKTREEVLASVINKASDKLRQP